MNARRRFVLTLAVTVAVLAATAAAALARELSASGLRSKLASEMSAVGGASGAWVFDVDAKGDGQLYGNDADDRLIPASNEKLFTTAAFLSKLGPDGHLETRAYARGKLSGGRKSTLEGDLVLVGDGDPAFGTARFARAANQPVTRVSKLAREIHRAGIRKITGRVLADDTIFDRERRAGPDLSPLSGLSFNDGYDNGHYAKEPELVAAAALKNAMRKQRISVDGRVGHANLPDRELRRDPLAAVSSPTAAKLIEETNVPSNNFFAEMLLKRLAAESDRRGTRVAGAQAVERFAHEAGTDVQAVDGSGLSRRNAVSPHEVGKLLVTMARDPINGRAFRHSLPIAGHEGTVSDRMDGTAADGNCQTKTGTLDGVSALSGYCNAGGHTIAFSVLNNKVSIDAAHHAQDEIAAAIARYSP
jgi:D-alanyl-D-alanine carboxypeptidase/D-alanyl-D-alanine-endopeptidase (penicillin-binding protein 4)